MFALMLASTLAGAGVNRREALGIMATVAARPSVAIAPVEAAPAAAVPVLATRSLAYYAGAIVHAVFWRLGDDHAGEGWQLEPGAPENWRELHEDVGVLAETMMREEPATGAFFDHYFHIQNVFTRDLVVLPERPLEVDITARLTKINPMIAEDFARQIRVLRSFQNEARARDELGPAHRKRIWADILRHHAVDGPETLVDRLIGFEDDLSAELRVPLVTLQDQIPEMISIPSRLVWQHRPKFAPDENLMRRLREGYAKICPELFEVGRVPARWMRYAFDARPSPGVITDLVRAREAEPVRLAPPPRAPACVNLLEYRPVEPVIEAETNTEPLAIEIPEDLPALSASPADPDSDPPRSSESI